jgi:polar amino acid transport system permease protein
LTSNIVELTRATSLAAAVSLPDLLRSARQGQDIVHNPTPLVAAAVIYLLWLWPLVRLLSRLEARMTRRRGRIHRTNVIDLLKRADRLAPIGRVPQPLGQG